MDGDLFEKTEAGTPQGGVISPLLANIALHGLEEHLKKVVEGIPTRYQCGRIRSERDRRSALVVIRYADDLIIMHESLEILTLVREALEE